MPHVFRLQADPFFPTNFSFLFRLKKISVSVCFREQIHQMWILRTSVICSLLIRSFYRNRSWIFPGCWEICFMHGHSIMFFHRTTGSRFRFSRAATRIKAWNQNYERNQARLATDRPSRLRREDRCAISWEPLQVNAFDNAPEVKESTLIEQSSLGK